MRKFSEQGGGELREAYCNCCGRKLNVRNGILEEGCVGIETPFGYFSRRDGQVHRFDLCEDCYDKWTAAFRIPVEIEEKTELL
ncbi:MAG: hypothetical protein J6C33_03795 [Lachnospiraceae bacterium]|nr:hypothetical protein [Lachnospiraceae bacterium]